MGGYVQSIRNNHDEENDDGNGGGDEDGKSRKRSTKASSSSAAKELFDLADDTHYSLLALTSQDDAKMVVLVGAIRRAKEVAVRGEKPFYHDLILIFLFPTAFF